MVAMSPDARATYPGRPITLVVGYPAGGSADGLARVFAVHMARELGQEVRVESRPGASGNAAAESVARAKPDGHTLFMSARPNALHKAIYGATRYDFARDLVPVALLAKASNVIAAAKQVPIYSIQDLLGAARNYPGALLCASSGVVSTGHLLCELFQQETQSRFMHVPYEGGAMAAQDLVNGRIDLFFGSLPAMLPHINAGLVRPLAMASRLRAAAVAYVPTIKEAGFPGFELDSWFGLMAPAGTPSQVILRLNAAVTTVLVHRDLQRAFLNRAYISPLPPITPEGLRQLVAHETRRWTAILWARNIAANGQAAMSR
jgi:tripartite-type tricarboxylate transporter receptor subunit TctC